jgi:hypothetical protein
MMHTIPHQVRMCNFPFVQRTLIVDTAPLSGDKVGRPGIGTMEQLRDYCAQLLSDGVVDRVIDIDYDETYRKRVYRKHLGSALITPTHNYKGYPILGTIFSLEEVPGDYVLHFDSDMLLYQQPDYSWINTAIELFRKRSDIIAIRPLAGPPHEKGPRQEDKFVYDPDGFYRFKTFGSRAYLLDRQRFNQFLPLPVLWRTYKTEALNRLPEGIKTIMNAFTQKGKLDSWEIMFTNRLKATSYVRANLEAPQAWTIHPCDRGPAFIQALPQIIEKIESGWYPAEQAGYYDLNLPAWLQALEFDRKAGLSSQN